MFQSVLLSLILLCLLLCPYCVRQSDGILGRDPADVTNKL